MTGIAFHRLAGALGAEVTGLDLRQPIDDATFATLEAGLLEHQVLFFREQHIEHAHHRALAQRFGEPVAHPAYPSVEGFPEINVLESTAENPTKIDTWHTDMTFLERPPLGSILRGRIIPERGGDTMFASLFAAWDALSDRMRHYLDGLTARHSFAHGFRQASPSRADGTAWARPSAPIRRCPIRSCARIRAAAGARCSSTGSSPPTSRDWRRRRATPCSASCSITWRRPS
jgi:taurine dioxygenase